MTVKHHGLHAIAGQHVGTSQPGWTGTDDRNSACQSGERRSYPTPAHFERFIIDITLDVADGDGTELVVQGTRTFTQTVLRAHATAHFRQRVGLVRQFRSFKMRPSLASFSQFGM